MLFAPGYDKLNIMRKRKGFTLVEIMVAMAVIIILAIVGLEFFRFCQSSVTDVKFTTVALNRARQIMEYNYWDSNPISRVYGGIDGLPDTDQGAVGVVDNGDYKTITVLVTWDEELLP